MTNKIFEAGIFIGTVICGAGLLALLGDLLSPPSSARAEYPGHGDDSGGRQLRNLRAGRLRGNRRGGVGFP